MLDDIRKRATLLFGEPYPMTSIVVDVDLSVTTKMLEEYGRILVSEANRVSGVSSTDFFSKEDMVRYLHTILWVRVHNVNSSLPREYTSLSRLARIPILWAAVVDLVGLAYDKDYGISFRPKFEIQSDKLMSPAEAMEFSRCIASIERNGFKQTTTGVGRQPEGDLAFMATSHLEGNVVSYRKDHPMYGFFSSFFTLQTLEHVTGMRPRIIYGAKEQYQLYLSALTSTSG